LANDHPGTNAAGSRVFSNPQRTTDFHERKNEEPAVL
jgi:hypothetical protein